MFTGIVEAVGVVVSVERRGDIVSAGIRAGRLAADLAPGASVAVNGCCLTVVARHTEDVVLELTQETLARTGFGATLVAGTRVNLERPLRADGRFDGHIVQGHVDGVGRVQGIERLGTSAELRIHCPSQLLRYVVEKGSVCVDGVSLTVADVSESIFRIAVIPYTLEVTTLGERQPGDLVNLEVDVIAKYVERLMGPHRA